MVAEFTGTLLLLAAVVGSGNMGERLAAGNVALALLANTIATGAALVAIILAFGPISGAHLNPAVTLADAWQGGIAWRETPAYILAQIRNPRGHEYAVVDDPDTCLDHLSFVSMLLRRLEAAGFR
jgi:glycerol uptake facilitator-like aquaporin